MITIVKYTVGGGLVVTYPVSFDEADENGKEDGGGHRL